MFRLEISVKVVEKEYSHENKRKCLWNLKNGKNCNKSASVTKQKKNGKTNKVKMKKNLFYLWFKYSMSLFCFQFFHNLLNRTT